MSPAEENWVEVMRTGPDAEAAVREVLRRAGIPVRTYRPGVIARYVKGRRSLEVMVAAQHEDEARRVLDEHLAEGEASIRKHMQRLPAELAVGLGAVLLVVAAVRFFMGMEAWAVALVAAGLVCLLGGKAWLRAHPRDGDS